MFYIRVTLKKLIFNSSLTLRPHLITKHKYAVFKDFKTRLRWIFINECSPYHYLYHSHGPCISVHL